MRPNLKSLPPVSSISKSEASMQLHMLEMLSEMVKQQKITNKLQGFSDETQSDSPNSIVKKNINQGGSSN